MKKLLSLALVLTLMLSLCSVAAFAQEAPAQSGVVNDGYIALDYTNEDGSPKYEVDPEWGAVFNVSDTIYDYYGEEDTVEGAQFIVETNTLVLTDLKASDRILRVEYFTDNVNVEINGSCEIGMIETYRAGLNITGSGSLTVNQKGLYEAPIDLYADKNETTLHFGAGVSVTVYEGGQSPVGAAIIRRNPGGTANAHITFEADHNGSLSEIFNMREQELRVEGYTRVDDSASESWLGDRINRASDPDGVYAGFEYTESGGTEGVSFLKLTYVESLGCYLPDLTFSENIWEAVYGTSMDKDEFEKSEYSFQTDGYGSHIPLSSPYEYSFHYRLSVVEDSAGSRYAVEETYDPKTEQQAFAYYTYAPIDGMDGMYLLTLADGVDPDSLSPVTEGEESAEISGFTLTERQNLIRFARKVVSSSDPDGIYGCREIWFEEYPNNRECVVRYVYDEKLGCLFEDQRFKPIEIGDDSFFDNGEFRLVYDDFEEEEYLTYDGFWIDPCQGDVYEDKHGVRYAVNEVYGSASGEWEKVIYTFELISALEDRYFFTLAEDVSFDGLTPCTEEVPVGDEVDFILTGSDGVFVYNGGTVSGFTLSGTVKSFLAEQNNHAEITIYRDGEEEPVATKVLEGTVSSYRIAGLSEGSYTVKVDKAYHIAREYPVTISGDTTLDMKICPIGDFNLDGNVDIKDVNASYKHAMETKRVTDTYAIRCGDVSRSDNLVDIRDVNALYKHVMETRRLY